MNSTYRGQKPSTAEKAKTRLLDPAPPGAAAVVSLAVTEPGIEIDGFPRPETGPSREVKNWTLPNGRRVWVMASHQALEEKFWALVADARRQITAQVEASQTTPSGDHLRAWTTEQAQPSRKLLLSLTSRTLAAV